MELVGKDKRIFALGAENLYRRLSVRECARIQTFPDDFIFHYRNLTVGYKMIGNAVPPRMAFLLAQRIRHVLQAQASRVSLLQPDSPSFSLKGDDVLSSMHNLLESMKD